MRFETKGPMKKDMKIAVLIDAENAPVGAANGAQIVRRVFTLRRIRFLQLLAQNGSGGKAFLHLGGKRAGIVRRYAVYQDGGHGTHHRYDENEQNQNDFEI